MPPKVALFLTTIFVLFLIERDISRKYNVSSAIWIPLIWIMIIASRPVSLWLRLATAKSITSSPDYYLSGNPTDRAIFSILIIAGIVVLIKRRIKLFQLLQKNVWISLFILYSGVSVIWSEFPIVCFKRWIKCLGSIVMILVILSDSDPIEAVKMILRRSAYVLIPMSVMLIKYFPLLGRSWHGWTGAVMYNGVALQKNELGNLCLVFGIFFIWNFLINKGNNRQSINYYEIFINVIIFIMILWLLKLANSLTATICFIVALSVLLMVRLPFFKKNVKLIQLFIFSIFLVVLVIQLFFDHFRLMVSSLGRDMTMTGRTELWKDVIVFVKNPLIGTGYDSYWLGERAEYFWDKYYYKPKQAHNGYLEMYINLGWIGIILLAGIIVSAYRKIIRTFICCFENGKFQMTFLIIILTYNITEAAFKGMHLMWFILLLTAIECPQLTKLNVPMKYSKIGDSFSYKKSL